MARICPKCGLENRDKARFCFTCGEVLSDAPRLLNNRYDIIKTLKTGGMGCIYKAQDIKTGLTVAIKKMINPYKSQEDREYAEKRFREEARLLSELSHEGLPKVTDFFITWDQETRSASHYIVMTFIEGNDLESIMRNRNREPLPIETTINYFKQTLHILGYLHSQTPPVVYRDMKPSNIMIQKENHHERIFLVDFGIAKIFAPDQTDTLIGTPGYSAPEQFKGCAEPASDIFSLGVVMHYLLTGLDPIKHLRRTLIIDPPTEINPQVPRYLSDLVLSMTNFIIDQRPSAAQALKLLEEGQKLDSYISKEEIEKQDENGRNLLHKAAQEGNLKMVEKYIDAGAYVNVGDKDQWTPLHLAVWKGHSAVVEILIKNGARVNAKNNKGDTPVHIAVQEEFVHLLELLVKNQADVNIKNNEGDTPMDIAQRLKNTTIISFLRRNGAKQKSLWVRLFSRLGFLKLPSNKE